MSDPLSALRSIVAGLDGANPHKIVAGVDAAVNLLRFVADPASVLKLQSAMVRAYHKEGGIDAASTGLVNVERYMIEAILAALAAAATGDQTP